VPWLLPLHLPSNLISLHGNRRADLKGHIRKGVDTDLAYLAPTLIPVPGAFQADGSNPMISHTAENILFAVKKSMILGDIGTRLRQLLRVVCVRVAAVEVPLQCCLVADVCLSDGLCAVGSASHSQKSLY
jgi:hypothetical protein